MDPRDLIRKNFSTVGEIRGLQHVDEKSELNKQINSAIEEMRLGKSEGRDKAQRALAKKFKDGSGGFDNSSCMRTMQGKVAEPGAFCKALEQKA